MEVPKALEMKDTVPANGEGDCGLWGRVRRMGQVGLGPQLLHLLSLHLFN